MGPFVDDLVVPLARGQRATLVILLHTVDLFLGLLDDLRLVRRDRHILFREGDARPRGVLEPDIFEVVEEFERGSLSAQAVASVDDVLDALFIELVVEERHWLR